MASEDRVLLEKKNEMQALSFFLMLSTVELIAGLLNCWK
jgi:hypothetical protein